MMRSIRRRLCCRLYQEIEEGVPKSLAVSLFRPYYFPLQGKLGLGAISNLSAPKFGQLVFEHNEYSCPSYEA